jgi:hypothetical protein
MGTEYKLIDDEAGEFFELGKGFWLDFDPVKPIEPQVREALGELGEEHLLEVVRKLEAFCEGRTLTVAIETWNDDRRREYTEVGTRYDSD